jgi:hypothetical protein
MTGDDGVATHPELGTVGIIWNGDEDLNVVGGASSLELGLAFDDVLDPAPSMTFDGGLDPYERLDGCGEAIGHELEFAIGRYEGNGPVVLEPGKTNALVEFDVLHFDRFTAGRWVFVMSVPSFRKERAGNSLRPVLSNMTLSFRPSRSSGMPER